MIKLENAKDNILKVIMPEKLQEDDFKKIALQVDEVIKKYGKIRVLIDASNFCGWEDLAAFEHHIGFIKKHHHEVECIAVIAGYSWHHWVAGTIKLFIHPEIKVFNKLQKNEAEQWLVCHIKK